MAEPNPFSAELDNLIAALHGELKANTAGELASYIPELAKVPADLFGIAVADPRGRVSSLGDAAHEFTIQSVAKPFAFAMLLDTIGRDATYRSVGVQPSGDPFNAIELDPRTNRPFNPMVNAGAIAVCGRLLQALGPSAFDRLKAKLGDAAGRPLDIDEAVFRSENETGHRNRAIGHLLRAAGVFDVDVEAVLDLYFRQCSIKVTAIDLAMMGVTLANVGTNPVTGREVFGVDPVRDTLSVMFTCGMYNAAGEWSCRVGLPAKSGVGGGIVAVVNRQLGIGVFSPRLDEAGNSVRGQLCCIGLAEDLGLHAFDSTNPGSNFLRAWDHGSNSRR
nr:glutaminase A [uncultured Rhodopila sp.]